VARLLEGKIAKAVHKGLKGKLLRGTLRKNVSAVSTGLDDLGDPVDTAPESYRCEGFVDNYDAAYSARAGIPSTDVQINIIAGSLKKGIIPETDDKVLMKGQWHQLREAKTDPATAMWVCRGFEIEPPQ
jgi:hypothetical protein